MKKFYILLSVCTLLSLKSNAQDTLMWFPNPNIGFFNQPYFEDPADAQDFRLSSESIATGLNSNNQTGELRLHFSGNNSTNLQGQPTRNNFFHPWENPLINDTAFFFGAYSNFTNGGSANDNWLMFGPITIPSTGAYFSWYERSWDNHRNAYEVYIDQSGTNFMDDIYSIEFTSSPIYSRTDAFPSPSYETDTTWVLKTISIPANLNGQRIQIGFRHTSIQMNALFLDEFLVHTNQFIYQGVKGKTYTDANANCTYNVSENGNQFVSLKLFDQTNVQMGQATSNYSGNYQILANIGTYTLKVDTVGKPYKVDCLFPGNDTIVDILSSLAFVENVNFPIICKSGFDVGVQSLYTSGWIFPGQTHTLHINAGDLAQIYNLNCATGQGGTVQITVTGPVTFNGIPSGALTPSINGNMFTYTIPNFGSINNQTAFALNFLTNTTAQSGNQICVLVEVLPTNPDNDSYNNTMNYCYTVINSYDPNEKETYPVNVLPAFNDYFTYTVKFQNTGTAPAFNITVKDTLSNLFDLNTFQLMNTSHPSELTVIGRNLSIKFPNIMLADSTNNEPASHGFFQYRIKPINNLPNGTNIYNTASIYFDFNAPVVTNTTVNHFGTVGINEIQNDLNFSIHPNPFSTTTTLNFAKEQHNSKLRIVDVLGQEVKQQIVSGKQVVIDKAEMKQGIYFIRIEDENKNVSTKKIVVQ
jgi:uncharacterized repeat protein (TIGR01451 family)